MTGKWDSTVTFKGTMDAQDIAIIMRGGLEDFDEGGAVEVQVLTGDIKTEGNTASMEVHIEGGLEYEVTVRKIEPMDDETAEVLEGIPRVTQWMPDAADVDNAHVYIDTSGRLVIMPSRGGALFVELKDVLGDVAPFSD